MHHLRDLNWCLDQAANMSMKIPVLGSAFGILVAAFSVRCKPATTAAIRYLRLSHGLTASGQARDRAGKSGEICRRQGDGHLMP
jgi:hypothetical protein